MQKDKKPQNTNEFVSQNVVTKALEQVVHESMIPYSEFVIMDRALPRVEDGLKPVQRRVLYSMLEVGVLPDKPYRKSARIVGDCMGKYHPHGDRSIYDTMVRMAQDFNMGEILVSGHGNFGSVDGDSAAAMRYTEARLAPLSLELLRDIEKDTVSWSFNFDDSCKEPDMLPGRFPNLLVNGGSGIAVGLATNIPTHNLREVCTLVAKYIDNPKMKVSDALKIMPGPDFPTGAYMLKSSRIRDYYETGKGKLMLRAKLHIENGDNGKKSIVITEIPYQVNKAVLLQRIAKLKDADKNGVLGYIQDIVDESDRSGMRAVIKLKKDAKVNAILKALYKGSDLQCSFNVNMVAIADGKPKLLPLLDIIEYYVKYQQKVIYNRTKYDLEAALKKEHILEGLLIAIQNIDEVVSIIKKSKNTTDAKIQLIKRFDLTDVQAQAILDMRLARLTSLEVDKLVTELNRLKDLIKRYTEILKNPNMQMQIVKTEIMQIAKTYGSDRKTQIIDDDESETASDGDDVESVGEQIVGVATNEEVHLVYSPSLTIKTVNTKSYNLATKELSQNPTLFEIPQISIKTETDKSVYAFTDLGNCLRLDVGRINQAKLKDKGAYVTSYCKNLDSDEKIVSILELTDSNKDDKLVFVTRSGMIKVTKVEEYLLSKQFVAGIKLKDDDELIYADLLQDTKKLSMFSHNGMGVVVDIDDITPLGRVSAGIKGMALDEGDYVVGVNQVSPSDAYVMVCENGTGKLVMYSDVPLANRNRKGVKCIKSSKLVFADILQNNINYVLSDGDKFDFVVRTHIPLDKRTNAGKKLTNMQEVKKVYRYTTSL